MSNFKTYDDIKSNYNLLDYICGQGFEINKKKSSSKSLVLERNDEKLLFYIKDKFYINLNIKNDKGDIINFVANRLHGSVLATKDKTDIFKAINIIKEFDFNSAELSTSNHNKIVEKKQLLAKISKSKFNYGPLKDLSYFTLHRALSKKTLQDPIFKDRIFNSYFRIESNGHLIANFAFGKFKKDNLVGLEVRNKDYFNVSGDHNGIFHSNYKNFNKVDFVFIAESGIDALSHFELFSKRDRLLNKNVLYISTGGNMYKENISEIFKLLNEISLHEETSVVSITDNDSKGYYYDHYLAAEFINNYSKYNVEFDVNDHFFIFKFNNLETDITNALTTHVNHHNSVLKERITEPKYGDYNVIKQQGTDSTLYLSSKNRMNDPFMKKLFQLLSLNKKPLLSHKPENHDDWNSALKKKKNQIVKSLKSKTNNNNSKPLKL